MFQHSISRSLLVCFLLLFAFSSKHCSPTEPRDEPKRESAKTQEATKETPSVDERADETTILPDAQKQEQNSTESSENVSVDEPSDTIEEKPAASEPEPEDAAATVEKPVGKEASPEILPDVPYGYIPPACFKSPDFYKRLYCVSPYLAAMTRQGTPQAAICKLLDLLKTGKIQECHLLSHIIGETLYHKLNKDPGKALAQCPSECSNGCHHGVIEAHIGTLQKIKASTDKLLQVCDSLKATNKDAWEDCVHGLGHGLLSHGFLTLAEAITVCRKREKTDQDFMLQCLSGVFMENFDRFSKLDEKSLKRFLPLICKSLKNHPEPDMVLGCSGTVGEGLMFYMSYNLKKSQLFCEELKADYGQKAVDACKQGAVEEGKNPQGQRNEPTKCP